MLNNFYSSTSEITPLTMAVIAQEDDNGQVSTYVLEEEQEYVVHHTPSKLIDHACSYFGSSLKGRQEGTRNVSGITHKAPVSIDPFSGMYFIPTMSPSRKHCSWLGHSHIKHLFQLRHQGTSVVFKNGKEITLDISYGSMLNQIQRTAQFRYILDERVRHLQRYSHNLEKSLLT